MRRNPWTIVGITLPALIIASYTHEIICHVPGYEWLHSHQPFYIAESIDKVLGVVVCVFAMWLMCRTDLRGTSHELGLSAPVLPAIAFALVASLPMLIGFAVTRNVNPHIDIVSLLFLTVFSPLVEEIEFRGFGVRQLQRGTGWPFWIVV
jgi:membrane protease YdiL (CAAX protease family)